MEDVPSFNSELLDLSGRISEVIDTLTSQLSESEEAELNSTELPTDESGKLSAHIVANQFHPKYGSALVAIATLGIVAHALTGTSDQCAEIIPTKPRWQITVDGVNFTRCAHRPPHIRPLQ